MRSSGFSGVSRSSEESITEISYLAKLDAATWETPQPLPDARPAVPVFDLDLLPDSIRPWIEDVSNRLQCPPDYPAVGVMVGLSSVIGRQVEPLRRLEAEAAESYRAAQVSHELDEMANKAKLKALKSELDQTAKGNGNRNESEILEDIRQLKNCCNSPVCKRYETNDSTVEKLGELLEQNPNGILTFRDELVGWLRNLDKSGHEGARAFYGLLQRFQLLIQPDQLPLWKNIDRRPNSVARISAFSIFKRLADMEINGAGMDEENSIPYLRFDDAGQEIFTNWRTNLERVKLRADEPAVIESHLSKYRSLIPSLALICHLIDGREGAVSEKAILRAVAWGEYLEAHARRIYSIGIGDSLSTHALGKRILKGNVQSSFKPKTVYDKHWRNLDREGTLRAIESLESLGWLRVINMQTGGRPSTICEVNPGVYT
jgi:putative DNA primase/helicase